VISPTGLGIRVDSAGDGHYGARRRNSKGRVYSHDGIDFLLIRKQVIVAPTTCKMPRIARPYQNDSTYSGAILESDKIRLELFYFEPYPHLIGRSVDIGQPIGIAQDITLRYPNSGMKPHVHLGIVKCDPMIFIDLP